MSFIDVGVTALLQSESYWKGDLSQANEANPIGAPLMEQSIYGLFLISGIWWIIIGLVGYYLPRKWARFFLLFVVSVHIWGASTWIAPRFGYLAVLLLILIGIGLFSYFDHQPTKAHSQVVRFSILVVLMINVIGLSTFIRSYGFTLSMGYFAIFSALVIYVDESFSKRKKLNQNSSPITYSSQDRKNPR